EIVVMAPNMAAYAPLLPAVIGEPGRSGSTLPYHLADVALRRTHPLLTAFAKLLDLPMERISRTQVLTLLGLPAVMRRFGLDESRFAALERWLARSHVAWGLDGPMKADFAAAEIDANSFAFGFDRMAAGLLVGREDRDWLLGDILPADPVNGPDAQALGALWAMLELLREWRAYSRQRLALSGWSERLQGWIEGLFQADYADEEESESITALVRVVAGLASHAQQAGMDPLVEWEVVREALLQALEGVPERQAFLAGGITFCGMVPQRAIPFRVVALLGLNDGDFPRTGSDSGLDLMQQYPRLGDRGSRMDDRYLFLEALMSARDALHLSYVGEGVQDGKPRNPALPLAELLRFLETEPSVDTDDDEADRPWLVKHAMQPFDARYFRAGRTLKCADSEVDPRWFSYSSEFASVQRTGSDKDWRFLSAPLGSSTDETDRAIDLRSLCHFYAKPAEWYCHHALGLSRQALATEIQDDLEPITADAGPLYDLPLTLMWDALNHGRTTVSEVPPARLLRSGRLAAGDLGTLAYANIRDQANLLLRGALCLPPFAKGTAQPCPIAIDLRLGEERIVGVLKDVYQAGDELWLVHVATAKNIDFGKLLPLYLQWALLRLTRKNVRCHHALLHAQGGDRPAAVHPLARFPDDPEQLRDGLQALLAHYRQPDSIAGAYFPRTSFAYAQPTDYPSQAAWAAWAPDFGSGEQDYSPGYNALLGGDGDFLDQSNPA
ncbi:MAG: exodeoxyribonuclease V subunit gamma, partial [Xanthomonadales bacterium]|nr:exodeoxyribonuclease V subunit gamma [Xanthomonadales bacterium]